MKWYYSLVLLTLFSCTEEKTDTPKGQQENPQKESVNKGEPTDTISEENKAIIAFAEELEKETKNSLDSIKKSRNWNVAINVGGFRTLEELYADDLQFYLKRYSKNQVIDSKRKWINDHSNYVQTYNIHEVEYPSNDEGLIRVNFDKYIQHDYQIDTVLAVLEMRYIDGEYRITKESDQITELRKVKSERGSQLAKGEHSFDDHRWVDMRDNDALAHDFVPYYISIHVTVEDSVTITMSRYSGSLREIIHFAVRNISYDKSNCILSFDAAMNFGLDLYDEEIPERMPKDEDYEQFTFKTLSDHLALISTDGVFTSLEGTRFWDIKHDEE